MGTVRERSWAALVLVPFLVALAHQGGPRAETVFRFTDPQILESSGLVVVDGLVVTTNDSGDTGRVFAVDPATGRTVGVTHWSADPVDVEALAPAGAGAVWVGDIGDNAAARDAISVSRVPVGRGKRDVTVPAYRLVYPDGAHDAETLLADPGDGRLYVATKGILGGTLYAAPARLREGVDNVLRPVGPVLPVATDGVFTADGAHLLVRGYGRLVAYAWPTLEPVASVELPDQRQGEGLALDPADPDAVLLSTEGQYTPVLRFPLPDAVRAALAADTASSGDPTGSSGTAGTAGSATPEPEPDNPFLAPDDDPPGPDGTPLWAWLGVGALVVSGGVLVSRWARR